MHKNISICREMPEDHPAARRVYSRLSADPRTRIQPPAVIEG
jgi:hypothetical protein